MMAKEVAGHHWSNGLPVVKVRVSAPDCGICHAEESAVRSIIVDPLVDSHTTWVGPACYAMNARATAALLAQSPRLIHTEVLA